MFIKKIIVNSYRGINNLEINFSQPLYDYFGNIKLSIIVGENGVGKSTLFKFLVTGFSSQNFRQDREEPRGEIEYQIGDGNYLLKTDLENRNLYPSKVIVSSFSAFDPYDLYASPLKKVDKNESITSKYIHVGPSERGFSSLDNVIEAIMKLLFELSDRKEKYDSYYDLLNQIKVKRAEGVLINYTKLRDRARWITNFDLKDGEDIERFEEIMSSLLEKVQFIRRNKREYNDTFGNINNRADSVVVPMDIFVEEILEIYMKYLKFENVRPLIRDVIFLNENDKHVLLSEMSSGEITMLFRFLPLVREIQNNSIILIDEPETHLHPIWIREFISNLVSLFSKYKVHIMIATHSPMIASDVPMECIIGLKYKDGIIEQYKPNDRTLGGDSSQLLMDVFELGNLESKRALINIDKIKKLLGGSKPSFDQITDAKQLYKDLSSTIEKYELYKMYKKFLGE